MSVAVPANMRDVGQPGIKYVSASLDPGALAATTAVDVDSGVPADSTDRIVVIPAPTLEARLAVQGAFVSSGTVRVRFINQSAGAATGGALSHTLVIYKNAVPPY